MFRRTRALLVVAAVAAAGALFTVSSGSASPAKSKSSGSKNGALFGVLSGENELSGTGEKGVGDPNGRGSATAIIDGGQLCFGLTVANIEKPTAAHIHAGKKNENGPVVVTLKAPEAGDPGASSGCVDIESSLARKIQAKPKDYYWNVHTADFPGGAIRGQVFSRKSK